MVSGEAGDLPQGRLDRFMCSEVASDRGKELSDLDDLLAMVLDHASESRPAAAGRAQIGCTPLPAVVTDSAG
jgi:hypothetical protein